MKKRVAIIFLGILVALTTIIPGTSVQAKGGFSLKKLEGKGFTFASGAGANSRISVGSTVLGGMMAAATLGAVLTPAFYVIVQEFVDLFPKKEITEKDLEI